MNPALLSENTLLLLASTAESATLWRQCMSQHTAQIVIDTYDSALFDSLTESCALAIVDDHRDAFWENTLDVCHRIRAQANIPVILLTESKVERELLKAYEIGVNECVAKPIGAELLLAKANAWLRLSKRTC